MASAISQSSAGTIIEDLVSDRSIPLKVCMIILNCFQLISSWIAVGYFIKTFEIWSKLELTLSLVLLISGNYIIPGIANAVIYGRRWMRSSTQNRKHIEEENKQAWVCLRISLSLIGLPTVGRYIETIIVSKKLNYLEKMHISESVATHKEGSQLNPIGTSRIGTSVNQMKNTSALRNQSVLTGMTHASSLTNIPEDNQRRIRKARRQYKRCEHDGALMALISGSVGAGPMAIGLLLLYFQREELRAMGADQVAVVVSSFVFNLLWLAATLTHFYPARHVLSEAEFERGVRATNFGALILLYSSHLVQVTLRVICFAVFASWFSYFVIIFIVFHWVVGTVLLVSYQAYIKSRTVGRPLGERIRRGTVSFFSSLFFGYVGIFDFVNANEGKTRLRYLIYYTFYYIENIIMLVVWKVQFQMVPQIRYPIPFVCCVLGLFWLGFILFQLYLYYFSFSPYGSSIIGLCSKKGKRRGNYAEEVREPIFGVPLAQSAVPLWKQEQERDHVTEPSILKYSTQKPPRPMATEHGKAASIVSFQSQRDTPSIYSQPSSQINFAHEKPTHKPQPPVVQLKTKMAGVRALSPARSSSDSSSDDDQLPVFSAKPMKMAQSQPDLFLPCTDSVVLSSAPSRTSKTAHTPGNCPVPPRNTDNSYLSAEHNSRSLDNIAAAMMPAVQPNTNTKRIGTATVPTNAKAARRPLPSKGQMNSLHSKRDERTRRH